MKKKSLLGTLILLTVFFVAAQILFTVLYYRIFHIGSVASTTIFSKLIVSKLLLLPVLYFLFSQVALYAALIFLVWRASLSLGELFSLNDITRRYVGILLWCVSVTAILSANAYFASHSLFADLLLHNMLNNALSTSGLKVVLYASSMLLFCVLVLSSTHSIYNIFKMRGIKQHCIFLSLAALLGFNFLISNKFDRQHAVVSVATAEKPNIFLIGFDALRPDYLGFFNPKITQTPHFDQMLKNAIVFNENYTTLARTFPSWGSLLTSQYPYHTNIRDDNTNIEAVHIGDTLPTILQKNGYETIYASDDRRFANINQRFGFDRTFGPDGTIADYIIGTMNDFPLSNLFIPSPIGKYLFPYNYDNHGSYITYNSDNFLNLIDSQLDTSDKKPIFLALHFNSTAFPFYWFNDQQKYHTNIIKSYPNTIYAADKMLDQFLSNLKKKGLMDHAIFVFVSDHGITLGRPHERLISKESYQGDINAIHISCRYYNNPELHDDLGAKMEYALNKANCGIDTSMMYGADVLSLLHYRTLLAFQGYGIAIGAPHVVAARTSIMDVAPTLLSLLHLPNIKNADGISLAPYLAGSLVNADQQRPFFIESAYSIPEVEADAILIPEIVKKTMYMYDFDAATGIVSMTNEFETFFNHKRQRAIILGDWMLAYYPAFPRYKLGNNAKSAQMQSYYSPAYSVLLNLKTGKWTTDLQGPFATTAPLEELKKNLQSFYGQEMEFYI